jgi:hypothetical protein
LGDDHFETSWGDVAAVETFDVLVVARGQAMEVDECVRVFLFWMEENTSVGCTFETDVVGEWWEVC